MWIKNKIEDIMNWPRRALENITKIIQWVPVLWDNPDWDFAGIYNVMRYQMKRLSEHLVEHSHIKNSEKYAKEINDCIELIDQASGPSCDLVRQEFAKHEEYWGKTELIFEKNNRVKVGTRKAIEEGRCEEQRKKFTEIYNLGEKRQAEARRKLFDIMYERIEYWYD